AAAGKRTEPPVSVPIAKQAVPAATAAPAPLEDPPVKCSRFQGLCAGGVSKSKWTAPVPVPYSQVFSLPINTAPAACNRATKVACNEGSWRCGTRDAAVVGIPAV